MNNNLLAGNREQWVDILRGIGICLVLLGHISSQFTKIIYSFHIPMFFLLSGWLWKSKKRDIFTLKSTIKKNFYKYIVPYFILCSINLIIVCISDLIEHRRLPDISKYIVGILYSRGTTEWMPNCSPLWYLTAIFLALCFFELIHQIPSKYLRIVVIIALGVCSALMSYFETCKLPWNADTAMMAIVFLSTGHLWKEKGILQHYKEKSSMFMLEIILLLITIGCLSSFLNPIKEVSFDNNRYGNAFLMLISSLSLSSAFFFFCYIKPWNGLAAKLFSFLGKHTIFIMGFDYYSGMITLSNLEKVGISNWIIEFLFKLLFIILLNIIWNQIVSLIKSEKVKNVLTL